ncbi:HipA domain-containing protein [Bradyrhizobium sp. UFLA05-112]
MPEIYFDRLKVATIAVANERVQMRYESSWLTRRGAFPISLSMPLGPDPVDHDRIIPWLANLLPESHLSEIGQQIGVAPQDILGLLEHIGRDTAGALAIGAPRPQRDEFRPVAKEADLERIINELPQKPFLVGEHGVSMSLAGVQDKLPLSLIDRKLAIPLNGTPSTHIIKPDSDRLPGNVHNEAFCLKLAEMIGLDTAKATTGRAGKRLYLLVERYDRLKTSEGQIVRVHQEDFCQLLGYFPSSKYEFTSPSVRSGPGLKALFDGAARFIQPGARLALMDAVIYNILICNVDAHAKNYSILIGASGSAKFAPLYDLMCGEVYPKITKRLAQALNGRREGIHVHGSDWQQLARQVSLSPARTLKRVEELCELVNANADAAKDAIALSPVGSHQMLDRIAFEVKKRVKRIRSQLSKLDQSHPDGHEEVTADN